MKLKSDTDRGEFSAKVQSDDPLYKARVAEPVMGAVDNMPAIWRELVHAYGYIDVYRAWRKGMSPLAVRNKAEAAGGVFVL